VTARLVRAVMAGALLTWLAVSPAAAADPSPPAARTPIQHAVFLMGESRSFDGLFGTYPGADGIPTGVCMPMDPAKPAAGCVEPQWVGDRTVPKFAQSKTIFDAQYNGGRMDGFIHAQAATGPDAPLVMGHYDERDVPYSWNVADTYVLLDRFFSSARSGSVQNHMYWVSGAAGSDTEVIPSGGFGDLPTVFDRLQAAGLDWKFYIQNYDRTVTFRNSQAMTDRPAQVERAPLLAFARFLDDPRLSSHVVDLSQYYRDLDQGTVPAVSYIVPAGGGASTPTSTKAAEQLGQSIINALTRSTAWPSSMLLWTYDGWGGWFDHVAPPQANAYGAGAWFDHLAPSRVDGYSYGFRVPALLVSPYARRGYVDHTQLDFTSIVRFITANWGLQPLTGRDATAQTFIGAFDFVNPGRAPVFLPATRDAGATRAEPKRAIIFLAYGIALAAAIALIGVAAMRSRRPRRRDQATKAVR